MTIAVIMQGRNGEIYSAAPDESLTAVTSRLAEQRIGALPVLDNGEVVGIFSERDIIYGLAKYGAAILEKTVGEVMTSPAITVASDTAIMSALSLMTKRRIRHLPVVESGKMIGLISIGDLVKHRIEMVESEANAMRDYIQMA